MLTEPKPTTIMFSLRPDFGPRFVFRKRLADTLLGVVDLMEDTSSDSMVAVKWSSLEQRRARRLLEDPVSESLIIADIQTHEGSEDYIIGSIASGVINNNHYMIMPFASGGELYSIVEHNAGTFTEDQVRDYFFAMVKAISFLHENDYCHLDASLENFVADGQGKIKLCDFGVACHASKTPKGRPGKTPYMPPEEFARGPFNTKAADMWTVGVNLFILAFGYPPFATPCESDVRYRHVIAGHMPELVKGAKLATPLILDVISRLLCPEETRFTAAEVLAHSWLAKSAPTIGTGI